MKRGISVRSFGVRDTVAQRLTFGAAGRDRALERLNKTVTCLEMPAVERCHVLAPLYTRTCMLLRFASGITHMFQDKNCVSK